VQLASWTKSASALVKQAGEILQTHFNKKLTRYYKNDGSFATTADLASEEFLKTELSKIIPDASFIAEESGIEGHVSSPYCWVIDPLDGTTNFAYGIPLFGINVALTYNQKPVLGISYDPMRNELFYAYNGGGSYCNGKKIMISSCSEPSKAVVMLDLHVRQKEGVSFFHLLKNMENSVFAVRKLGSAALDLAYLAAGRCEAVFLADFKWWDIAPGIVLDEEAGGTLCDFSGGTITRPTIECVASNTTLHPFFLEQCL
jgi:myo-inositol-1(or 4)-monophosphatase